MVLELLVKKEALIGNQHDSLSGRNAALDTFSFNTFTRILSNHAVLDKKEKHGPRNQTDRHDDGTTDGEPDPVVLSLLPFVQLNKNTH